MRLSIGVMNPVARTLAVGAAIAFAAWGSPAAAVPSTELTISGAVQTPKTMDRDDLLALPALTQTVTFTSGGGSQTHTYTGTSLWGVLGGAVIQTDPAVRNDILRKYVIATGTDGYKAVIAAGEISPSFGNRAYSVAYDEIIGGVSQPLGGDGFARTVLPGDVKGGRYVSNLADLEVGSAHSVVAGTGGGQSTSFSVLGGVSTPGLTFDLEDLQDMTTITQTVSFLSGSTQQTRTYVGVSLWGLLDSVGIVADSSIKNDILRKYVVATGSDGYKAVFSMGELNPGFGNQPDMIAFAEVVGGNEVLLSGDGFARIVVPGDLRGGRYVSNLISLEVYDATAPIPEPGTWGLMAAGLGMLVLVLRRNRSPSRH
ncbi:MAG: PEP-CTERM sorting domain-containing protein [Betaproteobacteria bacterium]|nr:PEP-CTERM sorting domain-containing protein [Betaproteobacteria bacterium]